MSAEGCMGRATNSHKRYTSADDAALLEAYEATEPQDNAKIFWRLVRRRSGLNRKTNAIATRVNHSFGLRAKVKRYPRWR